MVDMAAATATDDDMRRSERVAAFVRDKPASRLPRRKKGAATAVTTPFLLRDEQT
jgi:hypothetical protein